jgi:hypothetical protein
VGAANSKSVAELVVTDCAIAYTASNDSETDTAVSVLESRPLTPGVNLKRASVVAMLEHIDAVGSSVSSGRVSGHFFCTKGGDRRMVSITPTAAGKDAGFGAAHLTETPERGS